MTMIRSDAGITPARGNNGLVAQPAKPPSTGTARGGIALNTFEELWRFSVAVSKSGLAPKGVQTPEAIFTVIAFGQEAGLSAMTALQSIANINGRPAVFGDTALAMVRNSGLCDYYLELPSNDRVHELVERLAVAFEVDDQEEAKAIRREIQKASVQMNRRADDFGYSAISKRSGALMSVVRRFTIADAKAAQLWGKQGPWTQYYDRMLMWRCRGFNLRDNFGDVLRGMRTAEEAQDIQISFPDAGGGAPHSRTASLLERVKGAPSDTGTTVVPEPEAIEQAAAADAASEGETIDAGTGEVRSEEAAVPAQGEEPKPIEKDPAAFLSHGTFLKALEEVAAGSNVKPSEIGPWLEQYQANNDLVLGVRTAPKVRQEAFDAFVEFVASRG